MPVLRKLVELLRRLFRRVDQGDLKLPTMSGDDAPPWQDDIGGDGELPGGDA